MYLLTLRVLPKSRNGLAYNGEPDFWTFTVAY
jgi:hypothetical protein